MALPVSKAFLIDTDNRPDALILVSKSVARRSHLSHAVVVCDGLVVGTSAAVD